METQPGPDEIARLSELLVRAEVPRAVFLNAGVFFTMDPYTDRCRAQIRDFPEMFQGCYDSRAKRHQLRDDFE
jgi:hypothetical protein